MIEFSPDENPEKFMMLNRLATVETATSNFRSTLEKLMPQLASEPSEQVPLPGDTMPAATAENTVDDSFEDSSFSDNAGYIEQLTAPDAGLSRREYTDDDVARIMDAASLVEDAYKPEGY